MDRTQAFFFGFIIAGLVGLFSSWLLKSWTTVDKTQKRMFSNPPRPTLKPIPDSNNRNIGTDPDQSPLQVLSQGCGTIIGQLLLQVALLVALGTLIWFGLQPELPPDFLSGIIFAAVIGFLLQQIRFNWKKITQLYKMITNPPVPSLTPEKERPPNNQYVAAALPLPPPPAYPPLPPFEVVVNGSFEIIWRSIWLLILLYLLYLSLLAMYFYLADEIIQFFESGIFGI